MSARDGNRAESSSSGPTLSWRAEQLTDALDRGGDYLDPSLVESARAVIQRVGERSSRGEGRTVIALAGATGSGKSSLFNALVAGDVAEVGVRRPTTEQPTAGVWDGQPTDELLDWLRIKRRHQVSGVTGARGDLEGLVLIDLPDVDSRQLAHRRRAERILERADALLWVTDPQKYADARLHEGYLTELRDHASVMIAVLNQADRLDPEAVEPVSADLAGLIAADGVGDIRVLTTSTRAGDGVENLRDAIGELVSTHRAAEDRLVADIRSISRRLLEGVAESEPTIPSRDPELIESLSRAAGVPIVLDAVHRDYRTRAAVQAGWPLTRWARRLRPDPLRRYRLGDDRAGEAGVAPSDVRTVLGRSSLPVASPAARSAVDLATRRLGERASAGLPAPWADAVQHAARPGETHISDALDQAVLSVPLRARPPLWWSVFGFLQVVFAVAAVAGLVWLGVLAVLGFLQIDSDTPTRWGLPVPTWLLLGGLAAGLLLALLARVLARVGANRQRRRVAARLEDAIAGVAQEDIRGPIAGILQEHARTRDQLRAAKR